jgi:energy-coupling factor transport system permease protein
VTRPAAVGAWVLAGLAVTLSTSDPLSHAVVLAGAWLLLARRHNAERRLRPLAIGLSALFGATCVINGLLAHTGATVFAAVPGWLPLVGGTLTVEGFAEGAAIGLTLVSAVSVAAALSLVLEPADLVDALPGPLSHTGAAVGSALNLVPATAASFVAVRDAQRLRGWRPRGPRALVDLAVPVVLGAIDRSVQLAESMEARAFGSGRRTAAIGGRRSGWATATMGVSLLALAALVAARLGGAGGAWYPYPTPSAPDAAPLALAPAVLAALGGALIPPARD